MDITDASNYPGHADQLFTPETESEVAAILQRASQQKIPVTVCGALTGLAGGASPSGGWALSLTRLRKLEVGEGQGSSRPRSPAARSAVRRRQLRPVLRPRPHREHFFHRRQHRGQFQRLAQLPLRRHAPPRALLARRVHGWQHPKRSAAAKKSISMSPRFPCRTPPNTPPATR